MKTLDEVVTIASAQNVRLRVNTGALSRVTDETIDGLFHVPLLGMTILILSGARRLGIPTADVGSWTLATLSKHFEALRLSRSYLRWSVLLRRRCADALVFLEEAGLVVVRETPERTAFTTVPGKDFLRRAAARPDEIGVLTRQIRRAHSLVEQGGLQLL
jgi:hypothetical protein